MDCYSGHCGTSNANRLGAAPHRCQNPDASGTFNAAANGDQCMYGWEFEIESGGTHLPSPYSDTTGICLDHSRYHLADSTGTAISTTPWPACNTLPLTASGSNCYGASASGSADISGCTAVDFGCVSTTTGMVPHAAPRIALPRAPYHREAFQIAAPAPPAER
jgi:hypothetical protein